MSMNLWMNLWYSILILSTTSFAAMLLFISLGAFRELKEMLDELRGGREAN